ncbi:tyrosine-type recombinase/integrase [Serratia microhaemolytica]|uniref:tyrosine-type recombinase/integrase n=1 Tax=Serratia microhaemolytica TaxID=2675110 RepID=UPI000FDCEA95|nr:site-specific integrase [Serratia microhaemolytica]
MCNEITWDELLEEYFLARRLKAISEQSYRKVVKGFVDYLDEGVPPARISHQQVLRWRRHLLNDKKRSSQTWNNKMAHLRALYNHALEHELLPAGKNPFNQCNVPRDKKKKKTLTRTQMLKIYLLMEQCEEAEGKGQGQRGGRNALYPAWYWLTVLDMLRYTGIRFNQLLHIRLRDVNLLEGYLDLCLEGSKTRREWRVPIVTVLKSRLQRLMAQAESVGATANDFLFDVDRVVLNQQVEWDVEHARQKVRSFFNRLSKMCGFEVSPHRFRHTLATDLMKSPDRNLQLVKNLLGHCCVSTTMEYVELDMKIVGKTLESELAIYTDKKR